MLLVLADNGFLNSNDSVHELLLWYNIHKEHNPCQVYLYLPSLHPSPHD